MDVGAHAEADERRHFLTAWPLIAYWDLLANPEVAHFFQAGVFAQDSLEGSPRKLVSVGELSRVGALWLINSGIASAAMEILST